MMGLEMQIVSNKFSLRQPFWHYNLEVMSFKAFNVQCNLALLAIPLNDYNIVFVLVAIELISNQLFQEFLYFL